MVRVLKEERAKKSFLGFGGPNQKTIQNLRIQSSGFREGKLYLGLPEEESHIDKDSTRASLLSAINRVDSTLGGDWL